MVLVISSAAIFAPLSFSGQVPLRAVGGQEGHDFWSRKSAAKQGPSSSVGHSSCSCVRMYFLM